MADAADPPSEDERLRRLARAAARGDQSAAAELLRELQDMIYRFATSQLGDADAAADATQEVGLRLLSGVRRYEGRSRVTTWALGVTLNVCRERRRRRREATNADAIDSAVVSVPAAPEAFAGAEDAARLREALDRLPARQREAVTLRYYEQLSVAETADTMGCSHGAVKASVWQGLRRLRAAFGVHEVTR